MSRHDRRAPGRTPLGGLVPETFLRRYWQKRPLLVRDAWPGFRDPITPEELAGLAGEPEVESRLVLERGGRRPWQVLHGPFGPERFRRLPAARWTLLVQGVDRHLPALADLLERFAFVPRWRLDDVMVSFAPRLGTVGPHIDSYDVFLLQGRGRRRWQVQARPDPALRPGLDLRVLRRFRADQEWVLGPGDMLYVPPGVAHYGVALEDCLTYSIGFRAPSQAEVWLAHARALAGAAQGQRRYRDVALRPPAEPGQIAADVVAALRRTVASGQGRLRGPAFDRFVGELLTAGAPEGVLPRRRSLTAAELRRGLASGRGLERAPASRVAFLRRGRDVTLFADGRHYRLAPALAELGPILTRSRRVPAAALSAYLGRPGFLDLMTALVNAGVFARARHRS